MMYYNKVVIRKSVLGVKLVKWIPWSSGAFNPRCLEWLGKEILLGVVSPLVGWQDGLTDFLKYMTSLEKIRQTRNWRGKMVISKEDGEISGMIQLWRLRAWRNKQYVVYSIFFKCKIFSNPPKFLRIYSWWEWGKGREQKSVVLR